MKKHVVKLTEEQRTELTRITKTGLHASREVLRANILLKSDAGITDAEISEHLQVNVRTIERVRERCACEGLEKSLRRRKHPPRGSKLDGAGEAQLIVLACSDPPKGRHRWTMGLLADKLVELKVVDSISDETVRLRLEKKRAETLANSKVLHSAKRKLRVCSSDGRRSGGVPSSL